MRTSPISCSSGGNRNGDSTKILSLLLTADGQWAGRVWLYPCEGGHAPLRMIRVLGRRFGLHYRGRVGTPEKAFQPFIGRPLPSVKPSITTLNAEAMSIPRARASPSL